MRSSRMFCEDGGTGPTSDILRQEVSECHHGISEYQSQVGSRNSYRNIERWKSGNLVILVADISVKTNRSRFVSPFGSVAMHSGNYETFPHPILRGGGGLGKASCFGGATTWIKLHNSAAAHRNGESTSLLLFFSFFGNAFQSQRNRE
ncbi:hypothetical protein PUN28_008522 [Cardiocondyla obscurior]|uniref:Uncharacterized protein n=1 Tax=Cardiocondyla obscurior TaxID=286306 RepID=A0AAW2G315_9HYME